MAPHIENCIFFFIFHGEGGVRVHIALAPTLLRAPWAMMMGLRGYFRRGVKAQKRSPIMTKKVPTWRKGWWGSGNFRGFQISTPTPEIFRFFLKSEGKEAKEKGEGGLRCFQIGLRYFQGG